MTTKKIALIVVHFIHLSSKFSFQFFGRGRELGEFLINNMTISRKLDGSGNGYEDTRKSDRGWTKEIAHFQDVTAGVVKVVQSDTSRGTMASDKGRVRRWGENAGQKRWVTKQSTSVRVFFA
ncbi:hypothetical protein PAXRUDRAFT_225097 [Paxillus rubicundulus Ve08.2h10]|uniref:Uncharacterized protein n=1 Tax=Paxillus rubicundulus Ve08.2h10 TaxID=930991 RepID=A0A0D0EBD7_9AGAM|nr:hypothetical protein PAXRUDRAFT_225097 [Paxillus rubicundulus Ve08.2h10]